MPGKINRKVFSDYSVVFVVNYSHTHMRVPFSQDGAAVVIAFVAPVG